MNPNSWSPLQDHQKCQGTTSASALQGLYERYEVGPSGGTFMQNFRGGEWNPWGTHADRPVKMVNPAR